MNLALVTAGGLAAAFVLYGLIAVGFVSVNMPPFQNPDEPAHFLRADQVAHGEWVGSRFATDAADGGHGVSAGGLSDPALMEAFAPFNRLIFHSEQRAVRSDWTPGVRWSDKRVVIGFANTAVYPPFFYLPAALGVLVGRHGGMTVLHTLILSRVLTGVTSVGAGAGAIAIAGGAAPWLFAVLALPMSLALMASSSQDGLLLASSALAGALLVRALRMPAGRTIFALCATAAVFALGVIARPPYVGLAIMPLGLAKVPPHRRWVATVSIAAAAVAWSAVTLATALTNTGAFIGADPAAQSAYLLHHPLAVPQIAWATLSQAWPSYLEGFVGWLGWLDLSLPHAYHVAARVMLGVAAMVAMLGLAGERVGASSRLVIAAGCLLAAAGVFAIQYLTWTVPEHATVDGVQGRYFLPLALVATGILPAFGGFVQRRRALVRLQQMGVLAVAAFPVLSLAVLMRAVVLRYYLG